MMRSLIAGVLAAATFGSTALAADATSAVRRLLERENRMYSTFDASDAAVVYARDVRWQNPFGVRFTNQADLEGFLKRLFSRPGFRSAMEVTQPQIADIRILGPNAAVAWSYESSQGQVRQDGSTVGVRKSHILYALQRRAGRWVITDEMIMDERE